MMVGRIKQYMDWLFKDQQGRRGKYVIAEVPNVPLLVFMVGIVVALVLYPGFLKTVVTTLAYLALLWWSWLECRFGRSRFRKLLGYFGFVAVVLAVVLRIGF